MTTTHSDERWKTFNELVDAWLPRLTNAQATLLVYYFRHARIRGKNVRRNVFTQADGPAAKALGKSRQQIRRLRLELMQAGAVANHKFDSGKVWWYLKEPKDPDGWEAPSNGG